MIPSNRPLLGSLTIQRPWLSFEIEVTRVSNFVRSSSPYRDHNWVICSTIWFRLGYPPSHLMDGWKRYIKLWICSPEVVLTCFISLLLAGKPFSEDLLP